MIQCSDEDNDEGRIMFLSPDEGDAKVKMRFHHVDGLKVVLIFMACLMGFLSSLGPYKLLCA